MKVLVVTSRSPRDGDSDPGSTLVDRLEQAAGESETAVDVEDVFEDDLGDRLGDLVQGDIVVADGDGAMLGLARQGVDRPILPVGVGQGVESVPLTDVEQAIEAVLADRVSKTSVPTIRVEADGASYRALMDVMAVTAEAAKISEYRLLGDHDGREVVIDTVRADGIVASAPAGTPGYGTAAGGPILDPGLSAVSLSPVGPFRVEQPHWVLEPPISIEVARGEVPVTVLVDDREVGSLEAGSAVRLTWDEPVTLLRTPVSVSPLDAAARTPKES